MRIHSDYVGTALEIVSGALETFTAEKRAARTTAAGWTGLVGQLDHALGNTGVTTGVVDLAAQLRELCSAAEDHELSQEQNQQALRLQEIHQGWANGTAFTAVDMQRALETSKDFLAGLNLDYSAGQVAELLQSSAAGEQPRATGRGPSRGSISVDIAHSKSVNYATAHTHTRILERVVLENRADQLRSVLVTAVVMSGNLPVSAVADRRLELPVGVSTLHDLDVVLDPAAFAQIDSRRPGALVVRVAENGKLVAEQSGPIDLLPASHWPGAGTQANAELLAAFVQPQHPLLTALLSEAGDIFRAHTGTGNLDTGLGGTERVDASVESIVQVLGTRGIRFGTPPANWDLADLGGQYLRGAHEVLTERVGTSLETTLLVSALLEAVGINSVIWLANDHAFLAYWRTPEGALPSSSLDAEGAGALANLVAAGHLRIVESTAITTDRRSSLAESSAATMRDYAQGAAAEEHLVFAIDIRASRRSGITPLPARGLSESGRPVVIEYKAAAPDTLARFFKEKSERQRSAPVSAGKPAPPRITAWKNGLLDLSLRNRLLNFTERARLPLAVPESVVDGFEDLVNNGRAIELLPADEISALDAQRYASGPLLPIERRIELLLSRGKVYTRLDADRYLTRLRRMAGDAKRIVEENGANNLYLAVGSLNWSLDGRALRSPLFLVPVRLLPAGRGKHYRIEIDETGTSTPNYCLSEKLHEQFGLRIPGFEDPERDESGIDLAAALTALREALVQADLPFHVEGTVDLAILQFAKFRMWRDLDENWETFMDAPLVRHLVQTPTNEFIDPAGTDAEPVVDLDRLAAQLPVPADASQLEAVAAARAGRTFVLEGPPGTGKSQTITNLLAHAMANGQRVLFVAEKRAALEVVAKRLNEVGLGEFALDLHDKGSSPNAVRAQIKASLDHLVFADTAGMKLATGDLEASVRRLAGYAHDLHEANPAGLTAYGAHNVALSMDPDVAALPVPESFATQAGEVEVDAVREGLLQLPDTAQPANPRFEHPWGFVGGPLTDEQQAALLGSAGALEHAMSQATNARNDGAVAALVDGAAAPEDLEHLAELLTGAVPLPVLDAAATSVWQERSAALLADAVELAQGMDWLPNIVAPIVLENDLSPVHAAATEANKFGFLGLGRKKRRLRVTAEHFGPQWTGTDDDAKNLVAIIESLIEARARCAKLVGGFGELPGLEPGAHWNPFVDGDIASAAGRRERLVHLAGLLSEAGTPGTDDRYVALLREALDRTAPLPSATAGELREIAAAWQALRDSVPNKTQTPSAWTDAPGFLGRFGRSADPRGAGNQARRGLERWNAFVENLEPLKSHGLDAAWEQLATGAFPAADALRGFMRGTAESALAERLSANGFDAFNSEAQARAIQRFTTSSTALRKHVGKSLPEQITGQRAQKLKKAESRMGELARQLERRRGGLSVRRLMDSYGDLITAILPCVLVSPDSAARFFPPRAGEFDIVVFDEASQIRVADAIGTLGRAKSAVIVGDSKQMPPSSFAEVSIDLQDDGESELLVTDEESILSEAVMARVHRRWLSWHYRSQDESLIAFSNKHYYAGKLSSFPSPRNGAALTGIDGYGISLRRVQGTFHRTGADGILRTNPVEAGHIVAEIKARFDASPDQIPSIGVVTFNAPQRDLVESLLRDDADERLGAALDADAEGLFVKNLENVQGDERDVILFSTAFSANERGRLPLNFGPLNNIGGERRLNVAVTRARRQVVVFTSFDPADLRAEDSSALGIKHLRAYLDLAAEGAHALGNGSLAAIARDRHREQVAAALRTRGHRVETNVGLSDFRIDATVASAQRPDEPLMAILLDGEPWAARKTVGDRDGLPQEILRNLLGWESVVRIWLPAWLQDSEAVLASIDAELAKASNARTAKETAQRKALVESRKTENPALAANDVPETEPELLPRGYPGKAVPFKSWGSRQIGTVDELDELKRAAGKRKAAALLAEIVEAEGPIQQRRLARLAINAYGLGRVSAAREKSMLAALDKKSYGTDADGFFWPSGQDPARWIDYRTGFAVHDLGIEEISPREIANVMCARAALGGEPGVDELKRSVMGILGYGRMTEKVSAALQQGLELAVREQRLESVAGTIRPAA
ncbi:DUF3320 domain-containing protein [Paeniglutamicibacter psychrophenolicus]|uniref:DUF4011 domain-containing protein n=1 Tax=Paeniglutamicibacter psychrophenolicus TaxID=257454 RepID=A0ABS4WA38_9MICC|nr:DUF4011 domain-containing protein [Paeniglutamicibacter psychrophenolicus]MBP2373066.1 hypothetical protein [Paeniglutamicibacter psychrophenolicus]